MTPDAGAQPGEPSPADGSGPGELLAYRSAQGRWVVAAMIAGSSVAGIDSTVVAVALPAIGRNLHAGFGALQWTVTNWPTTAHHSPGNIFTYLPAQRVLMLVDIVFPGWVPFAYLAESQNIPGWLEAPAQALGYPFHTFIGGHLTRLGTRDDVVIQQEYVADLKAHAARAIDTFNVADVYKSVDPANPWAIFPATWTASPPRPPRGNPPLDRPARRGRRLHPVQRLPTR